MTCDFKNSRVQRPVPSRQNPHHVTCCRRNLISWSCALARHCRIRGPKARRPKTKKARCRGPVASTWSPYRWIRPSLSRTEWSQAVLAGGHFTAGRTRHVLFLVLVAHPRFLPMDGLGPNVGEQIACRVGESRCHRLCLGRAGSVVHRPLFGSV